MSGGTDVSTPIRARAPRPWSHRRIAAGSVLAAWAGLFWFLLIADRVSLFLSSRTSWVVPMAAVVLTVAAASVLLAARAPRPEPLRLGEGIGMTALVAPVVLLLALPPTTLGSFSAAKKSPFAGAGLSTIYGRFDETSEISLLAVAAATTSEEGAELLASRAGAEVAFVGLVARDDGTPADELVLTRYVVTCCAADATVVQVRVVNVTPGLVDVDDWVEVKGRIYPIGREVIVEASSIQRVPRPERPYLTP